MQVSFVITNAGVRCPRIVYGTAWKKDDTARLVQTALALGFRGIDTAGQPKHYHEAGVGAGLAASGVPRNEIYVQTKFTSLSGQDPLRIPYDPHARSDEQVAQSFATSLRNLRTDYVDSLVLHSPSDDARIWPAMEAIVDTGGARQLGISNCYSLGILQQLWFRARHKPAVVQNRFYADSGYDRGVRAFCREHGIVYQSFWSLTANPHLLAHPSLRAVAAAHGCTPAQAWYRYLTQLGIVPLTGTRSEAHMREDLAIFAFELSPAECASIGATFGER